MVQIRYPGDRPFVALGGKSVTYIAAPIHNPDLKTAIDRVLPHDIALAIAVKPRNSGHLPIKSSYPHVSFRSNRSPVHKPDVHFARLSVTPKNVLLAVPVEISRVTDEVRIWRRLQ